MFYLIYVKISFQNKNKMEDLGYELDYKDICELNKAMLEDLKNEKEGSSKIPNENLYKKIEELLKKKHEE